MTLADLAALILREGETTLATALSVFVRVGAALAVLPAFGEQSVPARIRLAACLAFTAIVAPAVGPVAPPQGMPALGRAILADAAAGLILGLGLRLLVHALQIAAAIAAQASALAQIVPAPGFEPQPAIGTVLVLAALALACAAGLHLRVAEAFIRSYDVFPAGAFPTADDVAVWGVAGALRALALGLALAAPFVIASLAYNLAIGAMNRAVPQLMVALIGAPAVSLGTLALLGLAAPVMLDAWQAALAARLADPLALPR